MHGLNRKILFYLLALWGGLAVVSFLGYMRLSAIHRASSDVIEGVYPSAAAALEVESAIYNAYQNTIVYCSYFHTDAKTEAQEALEKADQALKKYFSVSRHTSSDQFEELQSLLGDAKNHAIECLNMTDMGMTPAEFQTHIAELNQVQINVVLALRNAAAREQQKMLAGTQQIDREVDRGLFIFIGGALVLLVTALIISYRLSNAILPPVAALTRAAEHFSEKNLNVRIDKELPCEFGILAQAFNSMAQRIQHALEEERELQKQLLQAQKLESLGTLSGGIAHDFNNLLTSMMGFSQLAMMSLDPESQTYHNLDRVVKLGSQAAGLTRQLLTFSRRAPMEKQILSPAPMVKETIKVIERTFPETIQIQSRIDQDVANIEADATQIQQVVMNLCVNARDAMPQGGKLVISLQNVECDDVPIIKQDAPLFDHYVCLSIKDTGTGIPQHVQERIFEPFFTTKEVGKGTGLGLSIVHGIVKSHGGHIQLKTEQGNGTEFLIYLPAVEEGATEQIAEQVARPGHETLLLVEDDTNVRDAAQKMLAEQGYEIFTATNGLEGLETFKAYRDEIDLVITDVVMPEMDGLKLSLEIEQLAPQARVLLISGYEPEYDGVSQVIVGFLSKPFETGQLTLAVREALDAPMVVV